MSLLFLSRRSVGHFLWELLVQPTGVLLGLGTKHHHWWVGGGTRPCPFIDYPTSGPGPRGTDIDFRIEISLETFAPEKNDVLLRYAVSNASEALRT